MSTPDCPTVSDLATLAAALERAAFGRGFARGVHAPQPVATAENLAALALLASQIVSAAYSRGLAVGEQRAREATAAPVGRCTCGAALAWSGFPEPCGCRDAQCTVCAKSCRVGCFVCEYAGL